MHDFGIDQADNLDEITVKEAKSGKMVAIQESSNQQSQFFS